MQCGMFVENEQRPIDKRCKICYNDNKVLE